MAEFNAGSVVFVPMPTSPEMVLWALPGPAGEIPYADVEALVGLEFDDRINRMEQLEAQAGASALDAGAKATASGTAKTAAEVAKVAAETAQTAAQGAATAANTSADTASQQAGLATTEAGKAITAATEAEYWANEFDVTVTATTGDPDTAATATVTSTGPKHQIAFEIPKGAKGDKGDRGDDGEVSQAMLDAAVATLVDNAPEALNTLSELADALGHDPNFATTTATEIGKRALIDGAPAAYNTLGKLVTALQNHELGGSTDASLLTGALTDQVDASGAMVTFPVYLDPESDDPDVWTQHLTVAFATAWSSINHAIRALAEKSDTSHTHTKAQVGLGNVDNTSDAAKPVSTAQAAAIAVKADNAFVEARPAMWLWDGTGTWTPPAAANSGDSVLNLDSGEIHSITEV